MNRHRHPSIDDKELSLLCGNFIYKDARTLPDDDKRFFPPPSCHVLARHECMIITTSRQGLELVENLRSVCYLR